jgi:hypothetical protein
MISTILDIFTIINLLIYLYIVIAVSRKWKVSQAHKRLFFLALFSFLWILARFFENTTPSIFSLLIHLDFSLAALIAFMVATFALHFPRSSPNLSSKKELLSFLPIIILSVLSFTDFLIKPVAYRIVEYKFGYYIYITILIVYFLVIGGGSFVKKFIKSSGIIHQQLVYILIGYLIAITILLYDSVSAAITGPRPIVIDRLFFNSSILFSALVSYAMLKYRFMDIRVVIRKSVIYVTSLIIILALYTYLALILKSTIEQYWNLSPGWTAFILVALVALGFPPLKNLVERSINTLFKGKKSIDLAVKEVQEKMANKTDIEALIDLISQEIRKFLGLEEVDILLINRQEEKFIGQEKSLDFSQPMVKYLQEKGEIVVKEEIPHMLEADHEFDHKALKEVENKMSKLNIAVAIPVGKGEELMGLIFLGKKKSKEAFTVEDIKFLERLSGQALFALGNAVLYRDAMARVKAMQYEQTENN